MGLILKRRKKKLILVFSTLLVVFLCIGYAVLTSNLNVNGIFSFSKNEWNVYFDNIVLDENSSSKELPIISEDKSSVSFNAILSKPYDIYRFYIDVVNDSTLDAMIDSINLTGISDVNKRYIDSSITYFDGKSISVNNKLLKDARSVIKVELKYKDINTEEIPVANIDLDVVFSINYRQDDGTSNLVSGSNSWTFDYKGSEDILSIPVSGNYKLEVWGAQGGKILDADATGGYGGYSSGLVLLNEEDILYLNVGGQGEDNNDKVVNYISKGGYNGGGDAGDDGATSWAGGGGATHIATISGLLSELENNKENILIVSAGGGGSGWYWKKDYESLQGGNAGGFIGNKGNGPAPGTGGTQIAGGYFVDKNSNSQIEDGSFGKGASYFNYSSNRISGGGGGSGFYGGGTGYTHGSTGGGGSSYIGNPLLTDKAMYCYKCRESLEESTKTISTFDVSSNPISQYAKIGNGYARITYMG